jgi:hypothetical protein
MTVPSQNRNWISIAEQASVEKDPAKLAILVKQLCCALDDRGAPAEDETKKEIEQTGAPGPGSLAYGGSD